MKSNEVKSMIPIFLVLVVFAIIVGFVVFDTISFATSAEEVEAVVVNSYTQRKSAKKGKVKHVYVDYEYNGVEYDNVRISKDVHGMPDEGEIITVYLKPEKPTELRGLRWSYTGIFFGVFFVVWISIVIYANINTYSNKKKKRKNKYKTGNLIMATVDQIISDNRIEINGKRRQVIRCSYIDRFTGQRYEFISDRVWDNLDSTFAVGDRIPVYVMPNDYSKYYVELEPEQSNLAEFTR